MILNTLYTFCCEPCRCLVHRIKRECFRGEGLDVRHVAHQLLPIPENSLSELVVGRHSAHLVAGEIAELPTGQMFFGGNTEILDERRTDDAEDRLRHVLQRLVRSENFVIPFVPMDVFVPERRFS